MKYYKKPFEKIVEEENYSFINQKFSELQKQITDTNDFYFIKQLAPDIWSASEVLKHHILFTHPNDIFEHLYKTRFCLNELQFCQLQDFLFSFANSSGNSTGPVVPYVENYFFDIFDNVKQLPHTYANIFYEYFELTKKSQDSYFFFENSGSDLSILKKPDYEIFPSFSIEMQSSHDFIKFAQHFIVFNYFKTFLNSPEEVSSQQNLPPFFHFVQHLLLKDNTNPRIMETTVFAKLMNQEHWNCLASYPQDDLFINFLDILFFYDQGRANSTNPFNYSCPSNKMLHFVKYDVLQNIHDKNIDLTCLFNTKSKFKSFHDFFSYILEKKHIEPGYSLDQEGLQHAHSLLKKQEYFQMHNQFSDRFPYDSNTHFHSKKSKI